MLASATLLLSFLTLKEPFFGVKIPFQTYLRVPENIRKSKRKYGLLPEHCMSTRLVIGDFGRKMFRLLVWGDLSMWKSIW